MVASMTNQTNTSRTNDEVDEHLDPPPLPHRLRVPTRFFLDHAARGCLHPDDPDNLHRTIIVSNGSRGVVVEMSSAALDELLSDAAFYSDCVRDMGPEYLGLQSSARATVRCITAFLEGQEAS